MKINWLIDGDLFDGYRDELIAAIHDQGHTAQSHPHSQPTVFAGTISGARTATRFPRVRASVSHGDIELVTRIRRERRWTPGAFATVENFFWSSYACRYGEYLLNREYIMLPFRELERRREFLFRTVGRDDRIFVRPDSPLKLFTGQVVTKQTFDADLEFMAFYEFPIDSLVVVGAPREIEAEWRFVVADHAVVAGSRYKSGEVLDYRPEYDDNALQLATTIAALEYQPDPVWVMDICRLRDGSYHLLEIGGFSFADLYECNKADVVRAVSEVAEAVWREEHAPK